MSANKEAENIVRLCHQGQWHEALELCRQLLRVSDKNSEATLNELLADIYIAMGQHNNAESQLHRMTARHPQRLDYVQTLSELYGYLKMPQKAIGQYQHFLENNPRHANGYFNLARLYKQQGDCGQAEKNYRQALALNIGDPEEVYTNIAVIYSESRREEEAKNYFIQALAINPDYIPALFNLATVLEELGDKEEAIEQYHKILQKQPDNIEVLSRLIHAKKLCPGDQEILERLFRLLSAGDTTKTGKTSQLELEAGYFALGKGYDDLALYDRAFANYEMANKLCLRRMPPYNKQETESRVCHISKTFDGRWLDSNRGTESFSPIFICGMFRSGTTLVEQILGAHSTITSGGELDLLKRSFQQAGVLPDKPVLSDPLQVKALGNLYKQGVNRLFPEAQRVTDKRPDNFWHLGLINAMFPKARIIFTDRPPLDVCLSVYFQHLGNELTYGADLMTTAHYYLQYKKMMHHWCNIMPNSLFHLDYCKLILDPQGTTRALLEFCDLPWEPQCMHFYKSKSAVKTASIWQVRQPLYRHALDRWQNYEKYLYSTKEYLATELDKSEL